MIILLVVDKLALLCMIRRYTAEQEAKLDRKGDDQSSENGFVVLVFALGRPNGDQVDPILDAFPPVFIDR